MTASVEITLDSGSWLGPTTVERLRSVRPNPNAPTFGEVIDRALDDGERRELEAHLRLQLEVGTGRAFSVGCFLTARLPS